MAISSGNGHGGHALDHGLLKDEAIQITGAVSRIVEMTDQVSEGADAQLRSLDSALSGLNEMSASLKETATQAESVSASTESLASSISEVAASVEQVTRNSEMFATFVRQTVTAIQQSNDSIQRTTSAAKDMATMAQEVTTSMTEVTASVKSTTSDTQNLASSVNETAAAIEEMTRSIQGVATNADDLAAAAEETSSAINETAASIEEVTAMVDSLTATIEQNSASTEQMARSVQSVARSGQQISDAAAGAATSATQLDRASQSVAGLAKEADEITRRASLDAKEGGASVQRSIQGFARVKDAMAQSSTVIREMGKRANEISSIVDTINLIAERTNLLSLNASIEAARAGDAGRGFAVVAEEIRNLADRSAKATSDIAAIIRALQDVAREAVDASNEGLRIADQSNSQAEEGAKGLATILDGVTAASKVVAGIARASDEQREAAKSMIADDHGHRRAGQAGGHRHRRTGAVGDDACADKLPCSEDLARGQEGDDRTGARGARHPEGRPEHQGAGLAGAESDSAASENGRAKSPKRPNRCVAAPRTRRARWRSRRPPARRLDGRPRNLHRLISTTTKAVTEQASAMSEISKAADGMRVQSEQVSRATADQAKTMRDMTGDVAECRQTDHAHLQG